MIIKVLASGSKGNCYLVDDGQTKILIEAGISWREIQCKLDFKTSEIQACLISHMHQDHCKAINEVRKFGIPIFSPEYIQSGDRFTVPITNHTWNILAFDAVHDVPCLGFLLESVTSGEKLLYLSDSAYCKYRFEGLTHIMIGTNYDADLLNKGIAEGTVDRSERHRLIHAHASLQTVKEMLLANDLSKVQGIWLLHLSSRNADAERFKKEIQELTGKVLHLPDE
ncbi:MAG: MBL fold metallo-hydrolase [Sphaerochaeta sp.]|jgi:phosphoribosyl 1,2-cyclic phosphodiesterase|nr:MBL fold metallo-hydrolase [Sphaerochaeta sp.]